MRHKISRRFRLLAGLTTFGLLGAFSPASAADPVLLASSGSTFVAADGDGGAWTIGNEILSLRLGRAASGGHAVLGLGLAGGEDRLDPAALPDLSFVAGAKRLVPGQGSLAMRNVQALDSAGGVRLSLVFEDAANHVRMTRSYACYPGAPGVETWSTFEVLGTSGAVALSDIGVWQLSVPVTEINWVTGLKATAIDGGRFTRRQALLQNGRFELGSTGRSSDSALPVAWLKGPAGHLFAGLMWSGAWSLTVTGPDAGGLATIRLSLGAVSTSINAGKPLESPHAFFGLAGGQPSDVTAALQAFARHDVRQGRPLTPLVTYNTWFAYGIGITEQTLKAEMDQAAALGAEAFVVDAGWYVGGTQLSDFTPGIGTWRADPRRFPSGLGALADHAHGLGMKFGMWIEPERTDTRFVNGTGLVRESWLATIGERYNPGMKNSSAGSAQICLASAEARQWVVDQLSRLIAEAKLDYLKWDNNYWINCDRSGHGHDAKDGNLAHVKGLYAILETLRARHPDLVIENCAGGGNRLDFGMLRLTDVAWMDDESAPSSHVRHNLEGLSAVFPAEYLLSFVMDHPDELIHGAADMAYIFRSRLPGAVGMSLIGAEFDDADRAQMREEVELSKRVRAVVPQPAALLLTGQVGAGLGSGWDAVALVSAETGSAVVLTYAADGANGWATVRLQGLVADRRYVVRTTRGRTLAEASGADLMADGLQIPKREATAANVIVIEVAAPPTPLRH